MHKHHRAQTRKHKIRLTRQALPIQPVAEPGGMQHSPHQQLGLRIAASHARHVEAALFGGMNVGQA